MRTRSKSYKESRAARKVDRPWIQRVHKAASVADFTRAKAKAAEKKVASRPRLKKHSEKQQAGVLKADSLDQYSDGTPIPQYTTRANASRDAVIQTAELLEQILLFLPLKDVFSTLYVCKQFYNTISRSKQLHKQLFLQVSHGPCDTCKYTEPKDINHYPNSPTSRQFTLLQPQDRALDNYPLPRRFTPARLCPFLEIPVEMSEDFYPNSARRVARMNGERVRFDHSIMESKSGLWEQMYVSDPPALAADINMRFSLQKQYPKAGWWEVGYVTVQRRIVKPNGLRIRDILREPLNSPGVRWEYNGNRYDRQLEPARVIERLERQYGLKALPIPYGQQPMILLRRIVIPAKKEWRQVESGV